MTIVDQVFYEKARRIEAWFDEQWKQVVPPFYSSMDLRYAGFKLAAIDTNLFPGGYNNIGAAQYDIAAKAARKTLMARHPSAKKLLIVPENHTRNLFYLSNVACLKIILERSGLEVRVGTLLPDIQRATTLDLNSGMAGESLTLYPIQRSNNQLNLSDGFRPDVILLNNDLSGGVPDILQDLSDQPMLVDLRGGWWKRRKSVHFEHYQRVAESFGKAVEIDPWLIDPYFSVCKRVDFQKRVGEPCLSELVDDMLQKIQKKYDQYEITDKPFVILKADAGTYGMGVMTVRDAEEIVNLNRKQRNKMSVIKDGVSVQEVLIQEGVKTIETLDNQSAETVMYLFGQTVIGGFHRVNAARAQDENLNSSGMVFVSFDPKTNPQTPVHQYANSVVARLAAMSAGMEMAALSQ